MHSKCRLLSTMLLFCAIFMAMVSGWDANHDSPKRILFIDSYHEGYPWSAGITEGINNILNPHKVNGRVDLKCIRMDTKRNQSDAFIQEAAQKAKSMIESWDPDVVIASDDNASKYLIVPHFKNKSLPFVFCGVNWDASSYGLPCANVTGMIEVSLIPQLLETLTTLGQGERIGLLGADNLSNRKEASNYRKIFNVNLTQEVFVDTFDELKAEFLKMQSEVDMLILAPPSFLKTEEDKAEARAFFETQTRIPTGCVEDWITPYTLIGYTKIAQEQGETAAKMAMQIVNGRSPQDIPVVRNKKAQVFLNMKMARNMKIIFPIELVNRVTFVE